MGDSGQSTDDQKAGKVQVREVPAGRWTALAVGLRVMYIKA